MQVHPSDVLRHALFALRIASACALVLTLGLPAAPLAWAEEPVVTLMIQDHKFTPDRIEVPAGKKIKLVVKNLDKTPEEFESKALKREKVIPGGGEVTIWVGPLVAGKYDFVGEFHETTAKGVLIAN